MEIEENSQNYSDDNSDDHSDASDKHNYKHLKNTVKNKTVKQKKNLGAVMESLLKKKSIIIFYNL